MRKKKGGSIHKESSNRLLSERLLSETTTMTMTTSLDILLEFILCTKIPKTSYTGELVGGLVLDHLDALGLGKRPATPLRVTGIITVLIAMGLVSFSSATRNGKKKNLNDAKDCDDSKDEDSDHKSKGAEKKRHHEEQQQQRHLHELKPANSIVMTCSSSNRPSAIMLRRCDVSGAP